MLNEHYDVIIIGTGAGGGTLARKLAESGKRILLVERGQFLKREKENWDPEEVFHKERYHSKDTWYDKKDKTFQPGSHYFVGGATKMYGAALFRFRERDFDTVQHEDGVSPEWPLKYDVFEKYYCDAEEMYMVHGNRDEDPTEPPSSRPYPFPAVSHEPRIQEIADKLKAEGLHPAHAPTAIMLNEENHLNSRCISCDTCDGYPCLVHAKCDAEVIGVRPALKHDNVSIVTGAMVTKLVTNAEGTSVTEVVVQHEDHTHSIKGDLIVLAAGAANSAKILLASASDKHPNGLANGSDQVGRNYMFHNSQAVVALSNAINATKFQKTLTVNDFYWGWKDYEYPIGNIQMVGKSMAPMFMEDAPSFAPGWTLEMMAKHAVDFWLTTEDWPDPENRVTLKEDGNIKLSYTFNNQKSTKQLNKHLKKMLECMDCHLHLIPNNLYLTKKIPVAGVGHQAGTCRFGTDPSTSVLDLNCKAHEVDNLYVVDSSFFPSIAAVNPSLTIMANALRVGDHLLERMGA